MTAINPADDSPAPHESTPHNSCHSYKPQRDGESSKLSRRKRSFRKASPRALPSVLRASRIFLPALPRRSPRANVSVLRHRSNAVQCIQVKLHHHRIGNLVERQVMRHPKIAPVERKASVNPLMPIVLPP